MKLNKKVLAVTAILAVGVLAGCGSSNSTAGSAASAPASGVESSAASSEAAGETGNVLPIAAGDLNEIKTGSYKFAASITKVADGQATLSVYGYDSYLPEDIDPPVTDAAVTVAPERLELEPWQLGELRAEVAPGRLADDALALLEGMTLALEDPAEGLRLSETVHLCEEIRDFLLSASNLPALLRFVRALQRLSRSNAPWDPERHAGAVALLVSCGSDRSVRRLVHSVPSGDTVLRGELVEVLDVVCSDPLTAVAAALAVEEAAGEKPGVHGAEV